MTVDGLFHQYIDLRKQKIVNQYVSNKITSVNGSALLRTPILSSSILSNQICQNFVAITYHSVIIVKKSTAAGFIGKAWFECDCVD